ncbi:MAG: hypothetical protein ACK5TO_15120 [Planctomycetaceae bacterium]
MKSAIMKVTALSVVLGLGVLVVLQANRPVGDGAKSSGAETPEEVQSADKPADDSDSGRPQPLVSRTGAGQGDDLGDAEGEVGSADRKPTAAVRPQPRRPKSASATAARSPKESREEDLESRFDRLLDDEDPDLTAEKPAAVAVARRDGERGGAASRTAPADDVQEDELRESKRPLAGRPVRPRATGVGRSADDAMEDEDESTGVSKRRTSGGRSRVVSGGLSLPDEPEADHMADSRSAAASRDARRSKSESISRKTSAIIPAGQEEEAHEATPSDAEDATADGEPANRLGSDFEDPDEEFQPRANSARSKSEGARTQFADETEEADNVPSEAGTDEADEAAIPVSRRPKSADVDADGGFEGVDEPGLVPNPRSPAESRRAVDAEPDSDVVEESETSETEAETQMSGALADDEPVMATEDNTPPKSPPTPPAQPRSRMTEEDEGDTPVQPTPEQPRNSPPRKVPAVESTVDDDPLQIRPGRAGGGGAATGETKQDNFRRDDEGNGEDDPQPIRKARPRLTIDKKAPETAVLGRPMIYEIVVKNSGLVAARGVVVEDVVPVGIRIEGSKPQAQLEGRRLSWRLGTLEAGATQTIAVRVTPESEGTLSGVATVHFDNEQTGDSRSGPRLQVSVDAPRRITVGQTVNVTFKVRNLGKTNASGVLIHDVLPAALKHPAGDDLEYEIGDIPPGESREVTLQLTAAQSGQAINRAVVTADGAVSEETVVALEVVGPVLNVTRTGVKRLLPGRRGRFTNVVTNPTGASLKNVMVVETIPAAMDFLDASDGGTYDERRRTVTWQLGPLDPRESKSVSISLSANGRGSLISVVRASDPSGASGEAVSTTQVVGQPALSIEVPDLPGALDVGQEVTAVVKVYNRGTDAATNTRVTVSLPGTFEVVGVEAPVKYQRAAATAAGRPRTELRFEPIRAIDVKKFGEIQVKLRARTAGAGRLKVQAACDQIADPILREDDLSVLAE